MTAIIEKRLNDKNNHKEEYETNSIFEEIFDFIFVPILNSFPKSLKNFVRNSHKSASDIIEHKTSHKALEVLYNKGHNPEEKGLIKKIFQKIWFNRNNSKAVRNRLKAVKRELYDHAEKTLNKSEELRVFSIASGSARAVVETLSNLYIPETKKIYVSFLDKNPEAIEYSKEKVNQISFDKNFNFNWCVDTASSFPSYCSNKKQDIIEMVGLLDYFTDEKVVSIFKSIYEHLNDGGILITANIDDNKERRFVTNFIDWNMIYRNGSDLKRLAIEAGFDKDKIKIFYEPLKIHAILVAEK